MIASSSNLESLPASPVQPPLLDIKSIMKILPHRYPFLLVDKILEIDLEKATIVGQKNVTINEAFFQGHFPDAPIMPACINFGSASTNRWHSDSSKRVW